MLPTFSHRVDDEVRLGLLERRHTQALFDLVVENRDHLSPWLPWAANIISPEDQIEFRDRALRQFAEHDGFQAGIWYRSELVGTAGLHYIDWNALSTEIGYWIGRRHQGRGIVTRVVAGLCRLLFDAYGLNRIEIRCDPSNTRSRAVPERLGFREEGTLRQVMANRRDHVVYGLLKSEWMKRETPEETPEQTPRRETP